MNRPLRVLAIVAMASLARAAWAQPPEPPTTGAVAERLLPAADQPRPTADQSTAATEQPPPAADQPTSAVDQTALFDQTVPPDQTAPFDQMAQPDPAIRPVVERQGPPRDPASHPDLKRLIGDVEDYYTSPLRWDDEQWALFGGALGAVALAHHYDRNVRAHFVQGTGLGGSTSDLQDALPAAALLVGTYLYSSEHEDRSGLTVSWAMAEAAGLSTVTAYALKFAAGRERPDQTTDPNHWFESGSSFPSVHATAAFAIGTVFAESGSGGYRWVTRVIGYGVAGFTAYQRLKHNAHWFSDVVAGAALGASTAVFVLDRTYDNGRSPSAFSVVPLDGGLMLAYRRTLP